MFRNYLLISRILMPGITTTTLERVATATAWSVYIITLVVRSAIVAKSHTRYYRILGGGVYERIGGR